MEAVKKMWQEIFSKLASQVSGAKHPAVALRKVEELGRHLIMGREIYRQMLKQRPVASATHPLMPPRTFVVPAEPPKPKAWFEEDDANVKFAVLAGNWVDFEEDKVRAPGGLGLRHLIVALAKGCKEPVPRMTTGWWRKTNRYDVFVNAVRFLLGDPMAPNLSYLLRDLEIALGLVADREGKRVGVRRPAGLPLNKIQASALYGRFGEASAVEVEKVTRTGPGKYRVKLKKTGVGRSKKGTKK